MSRSNESSPEASRPEERNWTRVSRDPDPEADLGYECVELDFRRTPGSTEEFVVVVPADASVFDDEAYVISTGDGVCDLERMV